MTLWQLLTILRARWRRILLIWGSIFALGVVLTLIWPKSYSADADLVLDVKSPDPLGPSSNAAFMPSFIRTEIDVIESRRVAERAIEIMKLDTDPQIIADWKKDTDGAGDIRFWLYRALSNNLFIRPTRDSNMVTINYKSSDPLFAAAMANAYAQAYIDVSSQLRTAPASENVIWFKEQLTILKKNVDDAQVKLSEFRKEKGLVGDTQSRVDSETTNLNELASQLSLAQGMNAQSKSKRGASGDLTSLPEVMQNPFIQSLRVELASAKGALLEASTRLGHNHPEYKRLSAQVQSLESQLSSQVSRITASIAVEDGQGVRRVENLEEAIKKQKAKVVEMSADMDRMRTLQSQLALAESALQSVSERYLQTDLQSQLGSTNIRLLGPAKAPLRPSSPKTVLAIGLSWFLGMVFGVGAALASELLDRRIRSSVDFEVSFGMPLPLLGVIPAVETKAQKPTQLALPRGIGLDTPRLTHQA